MPDDEKKKLVAAFYSLNMTINLTIESYVNVKNLKQFGWYKDFGTVRNILIFLGVDSIEAVWVV